MRELKLVVLAVGLSTLPLTAQEEPIYELEEVVVTATRIEDPLKDIPWGTELLTEDEIQIRSLFRMDGILRGEAGVDVKGYGGAWALSTVSLRGSSSAQVLLMLDGRPLNWVPLGVGDLSLLDPNMIQRVEVVKGPISSLYGANALGGVINLITKDPAPGFKYWGRASFGSPWGGKIGAGMSYGNSRLGLFAQVDQGKAQGIRTNSASSFGQAQGKLSLHFSDAHRLKLGLGCNTRSLGLPGPLPAEGTSPQYGDSTATSRFDHEADTTQFCDIGFEFQLGKASSLSTRLYLDRRNTGFLTVCDYFNPEDFSIIEAELKDYYKSRSFGASGLLSIKPALVERLLFGFDLKRDEFDGCSELKDRASGRTVSFTEWHPADTSVGLWGELKLEPIKPILGLLTLRQDWNSAYGAQLSPTAGLIFSLGNSLRLRISSGQAFRPPTFNDRYWPGAGNLKLRPEIGRSVEVGFDYKPRTWFYLSGSGFRTKTEDLIAWAPDTAGYWYPANIDRSNILGSELKLKLQPYELVSLDLEATILDAGQTKEEIVYSDFITGETRTELKTRPAAFIPRQTISGDLRIRPIPGSVISLRCRYTVERSNYYPDYSEAPTVKMVPKELPSQFVVGLDLSQQILKKVDLHFGIDNLFDARLGDQFGNSLEDRDYPLPGRQFALELKVQP